MAATIVTVQGALQVLSQIVPLIQSAINSGQTTIDGTVWADALNARDAGLKKLDADIAKAKTEGR
jgi:hypothetical protein